MEPFSNYESTGANVLGTLCFCWQSPLCFCWQSHIAPSDLRSPSSSLFSPPLSGKENREEKSIHHRRRNSHFFFFRLYGLYPSFRTYGEYPFPLFSQENGRHHGFFLLCDLGRQTEKRGVPQWWGFSFFFPLKEAHNRSVFWPVTPLVRGEVHQSDGQRRMMFMYCPRNPSNINESARATGKKTLLC